MKRVLLNVAWLKTKFHENFSRFFVSKIRKNEMESAKCSLNLPSPVLCLCWYESWWGLLNWHHWCAFGRRLLPCTWMGWWPTWSITNLICRHFNKFTCKFRLNTISWRKKITSKWFVLLISSKNILFLSASIASRFYRSILFSLLLEFGIHLDSTRTLTVELTASKDDYNRKIWIYKEVKIEDVFELNIAWRLWTTILLSYIPYH